MHKYSPQHFLTIDGMASSEFMNLLRLSREVRWSPMPQVLAAQTVVLLFEKPSLRTRVTFEVAVRRLGGWPVLLGSQESRLGDRESVGDLARNLSLWVNAIVARVFSHNALE